MCNSIKPDLVQWGVAGGAGLASVGLTHLVGNVGEEVLAGSKLQRVVKPGLATVLGLGSFALAMNMDAKTLRKSPWIASALAGSFISLAVYGIPRAFGALGVSKVMEYTGMAGDDPAQAEIQDPRQMLALAFALADEEQREEMINAMNGEGAAAPALAGPAALDGDTREEKAAELTYLLNGEDYGEYYSEAS